MRHELIHTAEKQHACMYCHKNFSRKDHLKHHLRVHDPNKAMHQCSECGKMYASSYAYRTHLAHHAAERGELTCQVSYIFYVTLFISSFTLNDTDHWFPVRAGRFIVFSHKNKRQYLEKYCRSENSEVVWGTRVTTIHNLQSLSVGTTIWLIVSQPGKITIINKEAISVWRTQ